MKILHLIYDHVNNPWVGGGGAVRTMEIYRRMATRHEITVICGRYPGAKDNVSGGIRFRFVGTSLNNYLLSTFSYALKTAMLLPSFRGQYDITIEDFAPWNPVCSYRESSMPVIIQLQNYMGREMIKKYGILGIPFLLVEKYYPNKFKHYIVMVKALAERYRLKSEACVISNGISSDYFEMSKGAEAYLLFLGRIDIHQKGLITLLRAIAGVKVNIVIAGDGRDREKFEKLCAGITNIRFAGFVDGSRKLALLKDSSMLILPSRYEGQGIVVLEAAACGKPVIISDIPELEYAVEAGFGISFKTGDAEDLASKITRLLGNKPMRTKMGNKAREYAKNFTWDRIAEEYEAFLLRASRSK